MKLTLCLHLWITLLHFIQTDDTQNCAQPHFEQILSRTKRFLTFPKGSSFAVKRSFTKSLVENIPRGLSLTVDIGLYYPLPVSTDSWDLTKLLYRLDLSHTAGLSATPKPKKGQDSSPKLTSRNDTVRTGAIGHPIHNYVSHQTPHFHPYGPDGNFESFKWNGQRRHYPGYMNGNTLDNHITFKNRDYIPLSWNTYQGRNDRNDIQNPYKRNNRRGKKLPDSFESLESIFKVNIRACILRAICEFNDDALPSGKSLIMDTAKIFFDMAASSDSDEFAESRREKNVDCARRFLISCPHSPFEFFSQNLRLKFNDENVIKNMFPGA